MSNVVSSKPLEELAKASASKPHEGRHPFTAHLVYFLLLEILLLQESECFYLVKCYNYKHEDVEHAIQQHCEQAELDFFEKAAACLHVNVNYSWTLKRNELVFRAQQVKLASMIDVEIVTWGTHDLDTWCMGHKTLISDLDAFAIAERLLDEIRLALQEDQFS